MYNFQRGSLRIKCATNIFKGYFLWLCLTKWYICLLPRSILFSYQTPFFTSKIHLGNSCIWWTSLVGKTSYMKTKKAWIPLSPNWRKISYLLPLNTLLYAFHIIETIYQKCFLQCKKKHFWVFVLYLYKNNLQCLFLSLCFPVNFYQLLYRQQRNWRAEVTEFQHCFFCNEKKDHSLAHILA